MEGLSFLTTAYSFIGASGKKQPSSKLLSKTQRKYVREEDLIFGADYRLSKTSGPKLTPHGRRRVMDEMTSTRKEERSGDFASRTSVAEKDYQDAYPRKQAFLDSAKDLAYGSLPNPIYGMLTVKGEAHKKNYMFKTIGREAEAKRKSILSGKKTQEAKPGAGRPGTFSPPMNSTPNIKRRKLLGGS